MGSIINNISTMSRITQFDVVVSAANQTSCADGVATRENERQKNGVGRETFVIDQPTTAPVVDGNVGEYATWLTIYDAWPGNKDFDSVSSVSLAIANNNLYAAFQGAGLSNSGTDWRRLFRTGGAVEICIGTNAAADPARTTPVDGDIRLVVANVGGAVKATLYKQKMTTPSGSYTYTNAAGRSVTLDGVSDVSASVTLSGGEFSIPLSALSWTPATGSYYLGDVSVLMGDANNVTYHKESLNNQGQGVVQDDCYECQSYPKTWGRFLIGKANAVPTVTLTYPAPGAEYYGTTSVALAANAKDNDGTVSKVEFWQCDTNTGNWTKLTDDTAAPYTYTWTVSRGNYTVAARAYDNSGNYSPFAKAEIKLGDTGTGLLGKYYDDTAFTTLRVTRGDSMINFDWGAGTPDGTVAPDTFSCRWSGTVKPKYTETYRFKTVTDDGVKFYLNTTTPPTIRINDWTNNEKTKLYSQSVTAGTSYYVQMDQYENTGNAKAQLYWFGTKQGLEVIPESQLFPEAVAGNTAPTSTLTAPVGGATVTAPDQVKMIATAADTDQGVYKVEFFANSQKVGEDLSSPYACYWTPPQCGGAFTLKARTIDKYGVGTFSSTVNVTAKAKPSVALTAPFDGRYYGSAPTITIDATADDSDGTVSKVEFYTGGVTKIGEDTSSPYSYSWSGMAAGVYTITAKAIDNESYAQVSTNSATITVATVAEPPSGTAVWLRADNMAVGQVANSPVNVWPDNSSNANDAVQTTTDARPTYVADAVNGRPVLRFDGANDCLLGSKGTGMTWHVTLFAVMKMNSCNSGSGIYSVRGYERDFFGEDGLAFYQEANNAVRFSRGYIYQNIDNLGYAEITGTLGSGYGIAQIDTLDWQANMRINAGTAINDSTFWGVGGLGLGGYVVSARDIWGIGNYGANDIAEIIQYNRALSTTERQQVENYLKAKYTLAGTTNAAPTVSVTAPINGESYAEYANITLSATAADSDGSIAKVQFFENGIYLGEDASSPYSMTWNSVPNGTYNITARAVDNGGRIVTSSPANIVVSDDPIPLNELRVWLKADAITGIADGGAVANWPDASNYLNNAMQSTSNQQPTFRTNVVNGKPVVRFDGTDDCLLSSVGTGMTGDVTLFVVSKPNSSVSGRGIYSVRGYDRDYLAEDGLAYFQEANGGSHFQRGYVYQGIDGLGMADIQLANGANFTMQEVDTQGGANDWEAYGRVNGGTATVDTTFWSWGGLGQNGYVVSARDNGGINNYGANDIAEILQYNRGLTAAERKRVEDYLLAKYFSVPQNGLKVWLKADAITGLTDGQAVTTWSDNSASANNCTQGTSGYQPTYRTNQVNGKPVVRFDGTDDHLLSSTGCGTTGDVTLFAVMKQNSSTSGRGIFSLRGYSSADYYCEDAFAFFQEASNGYHFQRAYAIGGWNAADMQATASTGYKLVEVDTQFDNGDWNAYLRFNGTVAASDDYASGGGLGQNGYVISARDNGGINNFGANDFAEILLYNRGVSAAERQQVENYLTVKYGL